MRHSLEPLALSGRAAGNQVEPLEEHARNIGVLSATPFFAFFAFFAFEGTGRAVSLLLILQGHAATR